MLTRSTLTDASKVEALLQSFAENGLTVPGRKFAGKIQYRNVSTHTEKEQTFAQNSLNDFFAGIAGDASKLAVAGLASTAAPAGTSKPTTNKHDHDLQRTPTKRPDARADEIELTPATTGSAPRRIPTATAVKVLREVDAEERAFQAEVAERSAALAERKADALAAQEYILNATQERLEILANLADAAQTIRDNDLRMTEIELWMETNWKKPMHEVHPELARREFVNTRLQRFIPKWQARADEISAELKSLQQK